MAIKLYVGEAAKQFRAAQERYNASKSVFRGWRFRAAKRRIRKLYKR